MLGLESDSGRGRTAAQIGSARLGDPEQHAPARHPLRPDKITAREVLRVAQLEAACAERDAALLRAHENHVRLRRIDPRAGLVRA